MLHIDQVRIKAILDKEHAYYSWGDVPIRRDDRWKLDWQSVIAAQLSPGMDVLDVGCGNGGFLLELSSNYRTGLGIDIDTDFLRQAEDARSAQGAGNVKFLRLDYPVEAGKLEPETFDLLVSLRGPVPDTAEGIRAARRLLRPGGLLYCEEIAEGHQKEVAEVFWPEELQKKKARRAGEVAALMEANGFEVRMAFDFYSKWIYPDVYAWFEYICNLWTWLGIPLLEPDDPRIARFAELNTNRAGEIVTTHHVACVGGVL